MASTSSSTSSSTVASHSTGGRGNSWRERETLDLLRLWGEEKVQEALNSCHRNLDVFVNISREMNNLGHRRSATECRTKTKTMRQEYKRVCAHNSKTGNSPATCPFFRQLDVILREDASARPKRIARSLKVRYVKPAQAAPAILPSATYAMTVVAPVAPGSEELFSEDLVTINQNDLRQRSSTPVTVSVPLACTDMPALENPTINNRFEESETQIDCEPETNEGHEVQDREPTVGALQDAEVADPQLLPLDEMSAEARLEKERKRMKRVAVLTDIGERMLVECRLDREENVRQYQADERRFQQILLEGERDRAVFQQAMDRNTNAVLAAVDALRGIGDVFREIKDVFTQRTARRRDTRAIASSTMSQAEPSCSCSSSVQSGVVATRGTVRNSSESALVELPASSSSQTVAECAKSVTTKRAGGLVRATKGKKPRRFEH